MEEIIGGEEGDDGRCDGGLLLAKAKQGSMGGRPGKRGRGGEQGGAAQGGRVAECWQCAHRGSTGRSEDWWMVDESERTKAARRRWPRLRLPASPHHLHPAAMHLSLLTSPRALILSSGTGYVLAFRPPPPELDNKVANVVVELLVASEVDLSGAVLLNSRISGCLGVMRMAGGELPAAGPGRGFAVYRASLERCGSVQAGVGARGLQGDLRVDAACAG